MVVAGSRAKLIERANNHRDDERARSSCISPAWALISGAQRVPTTIVAAIAAD